MPEIVFKGKEFVYNHHLTVPYRPLVPDPAKSIGNGALEDNLIVHGDNLAALKALLPRYAGKVDCIFIDPPYNTGNEGWSYNDNVNSPIMREWLTHNPVNAEDMLRHDKWCCMMWPRLRLLHELLAETGTFWMTIDDNEVAHARMLLDEVFGADGFLAVVCWQTKYATANDKADFSAMHDYLIVYAKSRPGGEGGEVEAVLARLDRSADMDKPYRNPDNDPRGLWRMDNYLCNKTAEQRPNLYYPIVHPRTGKDIWPSRTAVWRYSRERHEKNVAEARVWWGLAEENEVPSYKRFLADVGGKVSGTWWDHSYAGHTDEAMKMLKGIFSERDAVFSTPKPAKLLGRILDLATDENSLILDSFAGSGTTAHAVLAANAADGGDRRFILVECEEYADAVTAERVRRVISGYPFKGTQRETLLERKVTWTQLQKGSSLAQEARACAELHREQYDEVKTEVKDGALVVTGIRRVKEQAPGIGGSFSFCTLGTPMDEEQLLIGDALPTWEALADYQFYTATGRTRPTDGPPRLSGTLHEWYAGKTEAYHVWVIYRPDLEYLRSREAALTLDMAREIAQSYAGARHLVCAPSRFVPNGMLLPLGVEFAPLPYSLFRLEKD